jgi:glycosyltransferase involved in cell wall biosynthesis
VTAPALPFTTTVDAAKPRPALVCVTPVLNEEWILERFLACAALWADHIVIADQGSTDRSREIARAHPKVILVENPMSHFDERVFRGLLIQAAREIPEPRLFIALDADEALTANWETSPEWQTLLSLEPGTVVKFDWLNMYEGAKRGFIPEWEYPYGLMDDGTEYVADKIHTHRLPMPAHPPVLVLKEVKIIHFAPTEWTRYKSRQRWYQCWEVLNRPKRRATELYRFYHSMDNPRGVVDMAPEWLDGYRRRGIDLTSVRRQARYRWDGEVLDFFQQHGTAVFRRLDVWDVDWATLAAAWGHERPPRDPRSLLDRLVLKYLRRTQGRHHGLAYRWIDRALRVVGW